MSNRATAERGRARWLSRNVVAIGVVSLLTDASSEMVIPLLPVFVTTVLGGGALALGLIEGIADATASVIKLASGIWADRTKRRHPLVIAGYTISSVARPLIALATLPAHVIGIRVVDRVGKGLRSSPRDALLADSVPAEARGRAFGFHRAMDHAGAVVGPLLALGVLGLIGEQYRVLFALSAIPAALAVAAVIFGIREDEATLATPDEPVESTRAQSPRPPTLRRLLVPIAIFTLGNASDTFLLLRAEEAGAPIWWLPVLWALLHVVKTLASLASGALVDKVGARPTIGVGWILYAAIYVAFGFATDPWVVAALFVTYGVHHGLTEGPERALVAKVVPKGRRGAGYGWYHLTVGMLGLAASVLFGLLWDAFGSEVAFCTGAALALAAALVLGAVSIEPPAAKPEPDPR